MNDLTETRLASEQLLDGKLLKVYRDEVRLPDGETSMREWIDHPGAAAVVPFLADGSVLMVRQYRYAAQQAFLEVPAGKVDGSDESLEAVARRELEEETGWQADRLTPIGAAHAAIGYSNEVIHFFLAEGLRHGTHAPEEDEFLEVVTLDFGEVVARARQGEVTDMKTLAALFFAENHLAAR